MTDRIEVKAQITVDQTGAVSGIAWPFGAPDRVGDEITPGAFASAVTPLPMLFQHDQGQVVGVWDEIAETAEGLTVKGRLLIDSVARAREVHAMLIEKAVTGLSIGFQTKAASPRARGRTITALDLFEVSLVAVPCHPAARITSAKSAADDTAPLPIGENMEPEETPAAAPAVANTDTTVDFKAFEQIRNRLDALEAKNARSGVVITGPAVVTGERKAFENFMRRGVERMSSDEVKALVASTDAAGGFLAPEAFGAELIKQLVEFSPIRQYARVVEITASEIKYPKRVSGTAASWTGETADRTASQPVYDQLTIAPHELATYVDLSNALAEDNAYDLEGELLTDFAESFGKAEGAAFVKGTGTGQPKGILTATGITEVNTGASGNFAATNPADVLIRAYHKLPTTYAQRGVWLMNRNTLATVRTWKDAQGRYLVVEPLTAGMPATILGRPIVEALDMDDVAANAFPIVFGDLSGYRIVDRIAMSVLRDPFTLAAKGQIRIHARKRVGADLTHPDRFVKIKVAA